VSEPVNQTTTPTYFGDVEVDDEASTGDVAVEVDETATAESTVAMDIFETRKNAEKMQNCARVHERCDLTTKNRHVVLTSGVSLTLTIFLASRQLCLAERTQTRPRITFYQKK
jgi:hypothetical protein